MPHVTLHKKMTLALILSAFVGLLSGCTETLVFDSTSEIEFDLSRYNNANSQRGGRLYDRWWKEKKLDSPTEPNPIWINTAASDSGALRNNGGQWRCTECHGWDYKGGVDTKVKGLNSVEAYFTPKFVFDMIANGTVTIKNGVFNASANPLPHRFFETGKLKILDVYNLTKFIITIANRDNIGTEAGDVSTGKEVYFKLNSASNTCDSIGCHRSNSPAIIKLAKENDAAFLHKVRMGNPGTSKPGGLSTEDAKDVLAFVKDGINLIQIPQSDFVQDNYNSLNKESIVLGALLYDNWWEQSTTGTKPDDTSKHPFWPSSNTTQPGSETWRCRACHGWDYRGKGGAYGNSKDSDYGDETEFSTGIRGIIKTNAASIEVKTARDIYSYLKEGVPHGFKDLLTSNSTDFNKDEYYALTKFIMTMREEDNNGAPSYKSIDKAKNAIGGDAVAGKLLFESNTSVGDCSSSGCHGSNGKLIDFADGDPSTPPDRFLDHVAIENPWEFIHRVRFGQPGKSQIMKGTYLATMPTELPTIDATIDLLTYAQGDLTPNIKRGGLLYDKWWAVTGAKSGVPPATRNTTWKTTADVLNTSTSPVSDSETWQCVQCHGWDYQGKDGLFGANTGSKNYSNIRGLTQLAGTSESSVIAAIANNAATADHNFEQFISPEDITLLAQFILDSANGMPGTTKLAAVLNIANNDSAKGETLYKSTSPGNCVLCHGVDGKLLPTSTITNRASQNPPRFIHKVRFGHPETTMIPVSGAFQGLTLDDAADLLAYSKTMTVNDNNIPKEINYANADRIRGGRLYDSWWLEKQNLDSTVSEPTVINPQWVDTAPQNNSTSWECQSCHEWDYKGNGLYGGSTNLIVRIYDVLRPITHNNNEEDLQNAIFEFITNGKQNGDHRFGSVAGSALTSPMNDKDVWDITKFLLDTDGMRDTSAFLQSDGSVRYRGENSNGMGIFEGTNNSSVDCSASQCHGSNGTNITPFDILAIASPYAATYNPEGHPWRFLHRIRFGKPSTIMPSLIGAGLDIDSAYDVHRYAQTKFYGR